MDCVGVNNVVLCTLRITFTKLQVYCKAEKKNEAGIYKSPQFEVGIYKFP